MTEDKTMNNTNKMNGEIENLIDSGWGLDEIMQEAIFRGWNTEECRVLLEKAMEKQKAEQARWKKLIRQGREQVERQRGAPLERILSPNDVRVTDYSD
jgi:uncharacterized protein YfbU (UPF0304 family)